MALFQNRSPFAHGLLLFFSQKPAMSPGSLVTFWKEGSWERMGKLPLESFWASASRTLTQSHFSLTVVNVQTTRIQRAFQEDPNTACQPKLGKAWNRSGSHRPCPFSRKSACPANKVVRGTSQSFMTNPGLSRRSTAKGGKSGKAGLAASLPKGRAMLFLNQKKPAFAPATGRLPNAMKLQ